MEKRKRIIFNCNGGLGKSIMATAVVASIKKKYPEHDIVVLTGYPEALLNNPNVYRVYKGTPQYFMEDYINDDTITMMLEPYSHDSFIHKKKHLIEAWCDTCGVECVTTQPEVFLTQAEIEFAKAKYARNKPLFVLQSHGGGPGQQMKYSWARDIPSHAAQAIVDIMNRTHHVMHIRREDQPILQNCEAVTAPIRELFSLILLSDKRLFMDSFGQHCAAAFKLPSTVCWVGTKPIVYGYCMHTNIIPRSDKKFIHGIDMFIEETPWAGEHTYECPYDINNLFNIKTIVDTLVVQGNYNDNQKLQAEGLSFNWRAGTSDIHLVNLVVSRDEYGLRASKLSPGSTIVDIGANIGTFAAYAGKLFKDSKVLAYEPEEENFKLLEKNITSNQLSNVTVFKKAVSSKRETLKLFGPSPTDPDFTVGLNAGGYTLIPKIEKEAVDIGQDVECVSLEDVFIENQLDKIDLLKMDCEGAEYSILYNLPQTFFKKIMTIVIEVHKRDSDTKTPEALHLFLENKGYTCKENIPKTDSLSLMLFTRATCVGVCSCHSK